MCNFASKCCSEQQAAAVQAVSEHDVLKHARLTLCMKRNFYSVRLPSPMSCYCLHKLPRACSHMKLLDLGRSDLQSTYAYS